MDAPLTTTAAPETTPIVETLAGDPNSLIWIGSKPSDTPETDAAIFKVVRAGGTTTVEVVAPDKARDLERRLRSALKVCQEWDKLSIELTVERDAALAELERVKAEACKDRKWSQTCRVQFERASMAADRFQKESMALRADLERERGQIKALCESERQREPISAVAGKYRRERKEMEVERDRLRSELAASQRREGVLRDRLNAIYDATEGYADGAPDATAHDKLCNEISALAKP